MKLARKWAALTVAATYVPFTPGEFQDRLEILIGELLDAVRGDPRAASSSGAKLVELNCSGPAVLADTLGLLGKSLLGLPEVADVPRLAEQVVLAMAAFAGGCTEAVREATLAQQEAMSRAVALAFEDVRENASVLAARFDHVVTSSASGVALTDRNGRFCWTNDRVGEILGYSAAELTGLTLFDVVHADEAAEVAEVFEDLGDRIRTVDTRMRRSDGEHAWVRLSLSRSPDDRFTAVIEDHTELNLLHRQLNHQALHDMLTRLPNRQYFTTRLERVLRHADPATGVTIYQLDLDAFSTITLGLGRRAGDMLLEHVARRLREIFVAEQAMVARFAADEFAVLVENSPDTPDPVTTIRRVQEELAAPVHIEGHGVAASVSIGVVDRPPPDMRVTDLLEAADLTLARARRNGRTQWALFDPAQDALDRRGFRLAASLPGAWENGELDVVLRDIRRLSDERVVGVDALLSWPHTDPQTLAALAERTGIALPLGRWLMREACERVLDTALPLHVTLSPNQSTDPDLVGVVLGILKDTGLPADRLCVAMPGAVLRDDDAVENLQLLAHAGVHPAVHGTTSDDVTCLGRLPVWCMRLSPPDGEPGVVTRILAELVTIAHEAGATVLVDGVASATQATWWRSIGADAAVPPTGDFSS